MDMGVIQLDFAYQMLSTQSISSRTMVRRVRFQDAATFPARKPNGSSSPKKREMSSQPGLKRSPLDMLKEEIEMDDETRNNTERNKEDSVSVKERLREFQTKTNTRANAGFLTLRNPLLVLQAEEEMMMGWEGTAACEENEPWERVSLPEDDGRQVAKVAFKEKPEVIYRPAYEPEFTWSFDLEL